LFLAFVFCACSQARKEYYQILHEGNDLLIVINKDEAAELRRQIPSVHVHRTAKQRSKRHKYFVEESYKVLALLQKLRKEED
jgi:hypothetical protein